jgi:predicted CoA-binding protein
MKSTLPDVHEFLSQRTLALAGASRSGKKFGNEILKALKRNGYRIYPIHPSAETVEGERCYSAIQALPEKVSGLVICLPPVQTEIVVRQAHAAGITRVWLQQGAESYAALRFCQQHGINAVHGQCIMMFAEPVESIHKFHRWVWRLIGKYPSLVPDANRFVDPA